MENIKGRINLLINLTEAGKALRANHSSFWKADNGDQMVNVTCWVNEKPGPSGKQDCGLQLNSKKDVQDQKTYIGGGKKTLELCAQEVQAQAQPASSWPTKQEKTPLQQWQTPSDDENLPF